MARRSTLAVALALLAVLGGLAAAAGTVTVEVDAPGEVDTGGTVDATVVARGIDDADGLGAFEVNVTYDPALVSVDASTPAGSEFSVTTSEPEPGLIRVVGYVDAHPGPTGDVALADLDVTGEGDGTATVGVAVETLADADGNRLANATRAASLEVGGAEPTTTGPTTTPPSTTSRPGSSDDTGPGTPRTGPSASVSRSGDTLRLSITGSAGGGNVSVALPETESTAETGVRFSTLNLSVGGEDDFDADVTPLADLPADTPAPDGPVAGYLRIDHDLPDGALHAAEFTFTVTGDRLDDLGIEADDVVLYRYADGEWGTVSTASLGPAGDGHRYRANSPGFSVFAVGQRPADASFAVTDVALSGERVQPGGTVEVTATVENTGGSDGTAELELFVDGSVVVSDSVAVPAGETRTVTFSHSPDEAGSYEIRVNDRSGGTLQVGQADGTTVAGTTAGPTTAAGATADDATSTPGETPDDGIGFPAVLALLVVLAVLAGAGLYYRQHRE